MDNTLENLKSPWGGIRANSGRKPKHQFEAREQFNLAVDNLMPSIVEKITELVDSGDRDTLKWLIEQRIGKSPQSINLLARTFNFNETQKVTPGEKNVLELAKRISAELKILKTNN